MCAFVFSVSSCLLVLIVLFCGVLFCAVCCVLFVLPCNYLGMCLTVGVSI
jgi:hypothetical protein